MVFFLIKNYIFDLGQVIVKFDTKYMTSIYFEDEKEAKKAEEVIFDRVYWDKLDDGTITDEEVKEGIRSRLPESFWERACTVYDNWHKNLPFTDGIRELIADIHSSGGRIFLLSNVSIGFAEKHSEVPEFVKLFSKFEGLVFSGPLGIVKPSAEIFLHILNKYYLNADETVFIDDNTKNIAGAKAVGIDAYLFDGNTAKLREYLAL